MPRRGRQRWGREWRLWSLHMLRALRVLYPRLYVAARAGADAQRWSRCYVYQAKRIAAGKLESYDALMSRSGTCGTHHTPEACDNGAPLAPSLHLVSSPPPSALPPLDHSLASSTFSDARALKVRHDDGIYRHLRAAPGNHIMRMPESTPSR
jgi:hypothetical protein